MAIAKVIEIYPSKDKSVHMVLLKTSSREILHPAWKLYQLEIRLPTVEENNTTMERNDSFLHNAELSHERPVLTRSVRVIKLLAKFLDTYRLDIFMDI